jgi:hypothetical protein
MDVLLHIHLFAGLIPMVVALPWHEPCFLESHDGRKLGSRIVVLCSTGGGGRDIQRKQQFHTLCLSRPLPLLASYTKEQTTLRAD